jgi:hypothetical protein
LGFGLHDWVVQPKTQKTETSPLLASLKITYFYDYNRHSPQVDQDLGVSFLTRSGMRGWSHIFDLNVSVR